MITEPTVFVTGAGASAPYGFPLGGQLVDLILQEMAEPGALMTVFGALGFRTDDLQAFRDDLKYSGLRSIDAFLEGSDDTYVSIGKIAIAHAILWRESREALFQGGLQKSHWYEYLWNLIRPGLTVDNVSENRLAVITFNYERSFEYYFTTALKHTLQMSHWRDAVTASEQAIPVVHLHGVVGDTENFGAHVKPLNQQLVKRSAASIRVVHDKMTEDDPEFEHARRLIGMAKRIAFLGFGFHPANIRRLRLKDTVSKDEIGTESPYYIHSNPYIHATAYDMREGEIQRARHALNIPITFMSPDVDAVELLRKVTFW